MSYTHLTENERYVISHLQMAGCSLREIGRRLHRHHTTISREIQRLKVAYPHTVYWYSIGQALALHNRKKARHYRRFTRYRLVHYVVTRLQKQWSPEAISQRIRIDYHDDQQMRISHESIYRWIYLEANSGGQLHRNLRRGRKKRRRQKRYGSGRRFSDRKCITQRPPIVKSRQRLGDWEGDTMEGQKSSGLIVTLVERKSRYLVATKLQDKQATRLAKQTTNALSHIPRKARKTLTVDNGAEFAQYKLLEKKPDVYFAKPHAPWQRGANENTNGLFLKQSSQWPRPTGRLPTKP